jgi:hypothetical protein
MKRKAFTIVESLAMIAVIFIFSMIVLAIMRQRHIWPLDAFDDWLKSTKVTTELSK